MSQDICNDFHKRVQNSIDCLRTTLALSSGACKANPKTAVILGSGFSRFSNELSGVVKINYGSVPGFPAPTVAGHAGSISIGRSINTPVLVFAGRYHTYEGYSAFETTFPVIVAKGLGIETLVVTNAAGALHTGFAPGDIMAISDHISLLPDNPLKGIHRLVDSAPEDSPLKPTMNKENRSPFQDMTTAYSHRLREVAITTAMDNTTIKEGVLAVVQGPSYETPAEVRMLRTMGADAVCMSTVPEVIMAAWLGIKTVGFSLVTNHAAGITKQKLSHQEVVRQGAKSMKSLSHMLHNVIDAC